MALRCWGFTVCSLTAYRDEFGANFSRLLYNDPGRLPEGGAELLQFLLYNRAWFDSIQPQLPEIMTLASVRIGATHTSAGVPAFVRVMLTGLNNLPFLTGRATPKPRPIAHCQWEKDVIPTQLGVCNDFRSSLILFPDFFKRRLPNL